MIDKMELEVGITKKDLIGMFIRTDEKGIGKATYGDGGKYDLNIDATFYKCHNIKYSHNLIDLIEVGDYVNGYKISVIQAKHDFKYVEFDTTYCQCNENKTYLFAEEDYFEENDIESIVTHEQFDSVKYEVN